MTNMVTKVDLELTPREAKRAVERRDIIVVIDVLRSCSTIVNLLAKGALSIIPIKTLAEAYRLREKHPDCLLFGERKGLPPRGFDFGNSPLGFSSRDVHEKKIIMTTTSGTLAMTRCKAAEWVLIGSFLNAGAVSRSAFEIAQKKGVDISFVLSGDRGQFSLEDFICAGAIAENFGGAVLSDKVFAAVLGFRQARHHLLENIMRTKHAKDLASMGFVKDVEFSCQLDKINISPAYKDGKIIPLDY